MFAGNFELNHDLEKSRKRSEFLREISPRAVRKALNHFQGQTAIEAYRQQLLHSASVTADAPVLDAPRLRAGAWTMVHGLIALAVCAAGAGWMLIDPPEGLAAVILQIVTLCAAIGGVFLVAMGRSLRRQSHLPATVTPADIEHAQHLLDETLESTRAPAAACSKHIVAGLMTLDAAVLLFLVAPMLLPDTIPLGQLLIVGCLALLVARLSLEGIAAIAQGVRKAQVLQLHARKVAEGSTESIVRAEALRKAYDALVGSNWLLRPGLSAYVVPVLWAVPLIGLQVLLLVARLFAGDDTDMGAAMLIAGAIAGLTTLFALRTAIQSECLNVDIANAKRLLGRFPTVQALHSTLKADRDCLNEKLAKAHCWIAAATQPKVHGEHKVQIEPLKLLDYTVPAPVTAPTLAFVPAAAR